MNRIYVLDTSVLLQEPQALFRFAENDVVIPAAVLEELDAKKRSSDIVGYHAREVARLLDGLREKGRLHDGVVLPQGGTLKIELNHRAMDTLRDFFLDTTADHRILAVAYNLQQEEKIKANGKEVVLVSQDALMRIKADALNVTSEAFLSERVAVAADDFYSGVLTLEVLPEWIDRLYREGKLDLGTFAKAEEGIRAFDLFPHQFVVLKDRLGSSQSAVGRIDGKVEWLERLPQTAEEEVWGVRGRNLRQRMAFTLLLDPDIPLVTIAGKAGTGKTLLSLAAALYQVEDLHRYHRLIVMRPIVPLGKDIGYLPGEKEEKLKPWMQPIYDNLEYVFNVTHRGDLEKILSGIHSIQIEALTYIRGRSLPQQFILVDEAQNLTKHEVKTLATRAGEGSKLVLVGDPEQIDHPYLDRWTNGLVYAAERMKASPLAGHVKLERGERSPLAQAAADWL
ncbi:MAG: PhoH family protein [Candidatus Carbobacillus altaicus]|uniref:Putative ATPase related to phosphate starvation-inducible protein PhoH n=1 Tax=Candidatus Carbonibacillus altaicus TaxID=2163959 RepID=A0A2R6XXT6_9BACL|nr:PhoH family protein [Candidatus Carbobacillus altaicus]PTQ55235.1 MAG: putative ATPase related to phosphate starvation-inducible protein PhoH [Candidatus Carbobacillus altaicus]